MPLLAASRQLRIMAANSLPTLHSALLAEYWRQDREVVEATRRVGEFIERVQATKKQR